MSNAVLKRTQGEKKQTLNLEKQKELIMAQQAEEMRSSRRKGEYLRKQLEATNYHYSASFESYSNVKYQMRKFGFSKQLPGRDALKEALMFLETYKLREKNHDNYLLALRVAQAKVEGRMFTDANGQDKVVHTEADVEQIIKECLKSVGVNHVTVEEFIYSLV